MTCHDLVDQQLVLSVAVDDTQLGRVLCDQLLAFRRGPIPDLRDRKSTDWAVYKASGVKSVKQFQAKGWRVSLETVGDCVRLEAAPMVSLHNDIAVSAVGRPDHAALGALFRRTLRGVASLRDAGIV